MKSAYDSVRDDLRAEGKDERAVAVWTKDLELVLKVVEAVMKHPPASMPKNVNDAIDDVTETSFE